MPSSPATGPTLCALSRRGPRQPPSPSCSGWEVPEQHLGSESIKCDLGFHKHRAGVRLERRTRDMRHLQTR